MRYMILLQLILKITELQEFGQKQVLNSLFQNIM